MSASCLGLTSARALKLFVWTLWSVFDGFFCCSCSDVWWVLLLQLFRCLMGSSAAVVQMFDGFFCCSCSDVWWVLLLQLFRCLMGSSAAVVQMFDGFFCCSCSDVWWVLLLQLFRCLMGCMMFLCRMSVRRFLSVFLVLFVTLSAEQEENEVLKYSDTDQVTFRGFTCIYSYFYNFYLPNSVLITFLCTISLQFHDNEAQLHS